MLPNIPASIFLCSGGSKNTQIVNWLKLGLLEKDFNSIVENISTIDDLDADYVESQAFVYLAARFFKDLPT